MKASVNVKRIPYQKNPGGIIALLPNGKVEFFDSSVEDEILRVNSGQPFDSEFFNKKVQLSPYIPAKNFHLAAPAIAFIEITNLCNLECEHCYAFSGPNDKRKNELSTKEIFDLLDKFDEMGVLQVFLTGGEVFSHPDSIKIIQHAKSKKFTTQIFTNGTLLKEKHLANIPKGTSFFISFDTADPEKTIRGKMDFPLLREKFELMKKYGHVVRTAISVHNNNLNDVEEIFEWCKTHKYPRPQWLETHPIGRALIHKNIMLPAEKIDEVFNIYKKCMDKYVSNKNDEMGNTQTLQTIKFCQRLERATGMEKCSRSTVYINSSGEVYPCSNCMSAQILSGGNLRENKFEDIWIDGFNNFRKITFSQFSDCSNCQIQKENIWCQFRCPPLALNVSKKVTGCGATEYLKLFMLKSNEYWKQRSEEDIKLSLY